MADCMTFPNTLDEFLEQYQFKDSEEIYTNGSILIPVFRVKQWEEHINNINGKWIVVKGKCGKNIDKRTVKCSICGNFLSMSGVNGGRGDANYCPNCGAQMTGEKYDY